MEDLASRLLRIEKTTEPRGEPGELAVLGKLTEMDKPNARGRRRWHWLLGLLVSIACLVAAVWGFDRRDFLEIAASFRRADYWTLPGILALLVVFFWLKAVRWALLLRPLRHDPPITSRQVLSSLMIGFMGNNVLPAHLGDFVRVFVLGRQQRLSQAAILSTVVLERIFDVAAILAILSLGLALAPNAPAEARHTSHVLGVMLLVGMVGIVAYATWTNWFVGIVDWTLRKIPYLPETLRQKIREMLESGARGMAALHDFRLSTGIVVTSLLQWLLNVWMIELSLNAFRIDLPIGVSAIVMGVVAFGVTIPSSPGFFGIIQMAFRVSLVPFGVSATNAVAASVYYHLINWIAVTLVGLIFLQRTGLRLRQIEQAAEDAQEVGVSETPSGSDYERSEPRAGNEPLPNTRQAAR